MKSILRKSLILFLALSLTDTLPLIVNADRLTEEERVRVNVDTNVTTSTPPAKVTQDGETNNVKIDGMDKGEEGGGATGEGKTSTAPLEVNVENNIDIDVGAKMELSAHLIESVQGLNRGTYLPNYDEVKGLDTLETKYSSLVEYRNFDKDKKRDSIFTQDSGSSFSLDYIEALNWLYKHNYVHRFENVNFNFTEKNQDELSGDIIAENSATGGPQSHTLPLELEEDNYVIQYNMFKIPDELKVVDENNKVLVQTKGKVSGEGNLTFSSKGGKVNIITNEADGIDGTVWEYKVAVVDVENYISKNVTKVSLSERKEKEEYFFPKKGDKNNTISKKNYLMQLMKVVDGVEESRPVMFESRYELMDYDTGERAEVAGHLDALKTPFKEHIGSTGVDMGINDVSVDFNKYAMAKYYVNPNVYELYLTKAFNSGIIKYDELSDEKLKGIITSQYTFASKTCEQPEKNKNKQDPLNYLSQSDLDNLNKKIESETGLKTGEFDLSFKKNKDGTIEVTVVPKKKSQTSCKDIKNKASEIEEENKATKVSLTDKNEYKNMLVKSTVSDFGSLIADRKTEVNEVNESEIVESDGKPDGDNNGTNEGKDDKDGESEDEKLEKKQSPQVYDLTLKTILGTEVPEWDNGLGPLRINYMRPINNNNEYNVKNKLGVFGSSWSNPIESNNSDTKLSGEFKYNPNYKYFNTEELSYIEAVIYAYRAINAYADEKLPQREVDIIMSMYSINYGSLTAEEIKALNYLIAKGIIDGDNAAKFTSTQDISVEDAMILTYRIANPSARLTFKTNFGDIDAQMLSNGYAQSKVTMSNYEGVQPELEVISTEPTEYYIIVNKELKNNDYKLSTAKFSNEYDSSIQYSTKVYTATQLSRLGLKIEKGMYTVHKYVVPWDVTLDKLGYTHTGSNERIADWIDIELGGGFYLIDKDAITSGLSDLSFNRVIPDYTGTSDTVNSGGEVVANISTESNIEEVEEEPKGFFKTFFDSVANVFTTDEKKNIEKEPTTDKSNTVIDSNGNMKVRENKDIPDDNDPEGILNFSNNLKSIDMETFNDDGKNTKKVYIGINSSAKNNLLFDGHKLFKGGELNKEIVTQIKDIESIKVLESVPKDQNGHSVSPNKNNTFIEFIFPSTNRRSVNELKSLVKRRLTLTGESEIKDSDIASYTGTANGQTLISRKELATFGVTTTKDAPDILVHAGTGTYAYLNTKENYALISNTVMKFPENSLMIEINADEIYYNIDIVKSMMNNKSYYIFNKEGKYQIVSSMKDIKEQPILNPTTGAHLDTSYTAHVESYVSETTTSLTDKGLYLNLSSVAKTPATFFMSMDASQNKRRIYGFEPYYVKSASSKNGKSININQVTNQLSKQNADVLFAENVLINNAIVRQEFFVPKKETFLYVDNAIKVTELTKEKNITAYAEKYLNFISTMYDNMSEDDIRSEALVFRDANSYYNNSNFKFEDLLNRANYEKKDNATVKKLVDNAKKGVDTKPFWVLYFMGKFNVELPAEQGQTKQRALEKFQDALIGQFNKRYKFTGGFKLSNRSHINLLDMSYVTETDIKDKRRYEIKRIYPTKGGAFMSTDEDLYINVNNAIYMKLANRNGARAYLAPTENKSNFSKSLAYDSNTLIMDTYMNNGTSNTLTEDAVQSLKYQRDITGNMFYLQNGKLYNPQTTYYSSLPDGRVPLETLSNGSNFTISTGTGSEKMVVLDRAYKDSNGDLMVKVAKVKLKEHKKSGALSSTIQQQLFDYYKSEQNYKTSLNSLGQFVNAVNRQAKPIDRTLKSSDLPTGLNRIYFDADDKMNNTGYRVLINVQRSLNDGSFKELVVMDYKTNSRSVKNTSSSARLSYYDSSTLPYNQLKLPNVPNTGGSLGLGNNLTAITESKYMIYEVFLFNYGAVSVDSGNFAQLDLRTDYVLNTSPVLTDLVNELVKAVNREDIKVDSKKVGDLVRGDKLLISDGSQTPETLTLVKTATKGYKGHSHFISTHTMGNLVSPNDIRHESSLLISNYKLLDSVKIWALGQRRPLYNFIGNRELNLAKPSDIEAHKNDIKLVSLNGENKVLVETKSGSKVETKKFVYTGSSNGTSFTKGETKAITSAEQDEGFNYVLSLYLNSNLLVKMNNNGYYVIDGYGSDGLVNSSAFTSRTSRFSGVANSLLTVLPAYSAVDGRFLGFDLTELELKSLRDLFKLEWWSKLFENLVVNIEIIASAFGFYYVYALMVMVVLGKSLQGGFYRLAFTPVRIMTLGKLNIDEVQLRKFIPKCMFVLVLLTFTYAGYIREIILFTEEVRILLLEYFVYPFTR